VHVHLADDDRSRLLQLLHRDGISCRHAVLEALERRRGLDAGRVVHILDAHRNAVQRPAPMTGLDFRRRGPRLLQRLVRQNGDECVQQRIELFNAFE